MQALSLRAAQNCENALKPRCHCRCGGALHGARRLTHADDASALPERVDFEGLPPDDPHHLPTAAEQAEKRRARQKVAGKRSRVRAQIRKLETELARWRAFVGRPDDVSPYAAKRLADLRAELAALPTRGPAPATVQEPAAVA